MTLWMRLLHIALAAAAIAANASPASGGGEGWVSALDSLRVQRSGTWWEDQFRYARTTCLATEEEGAGLTFEFTGSGVALGLGQPGVPAYTRIPELGRLIVTVDDGSPRVLYPAEEGREVVLARGLTDGQHWVRVIHQPHAGEVGCRVSGFRVLAEDTGDLSFFLNGEENAFFVDARAVARRGGEVVRDVLVRNWLTGACRLTGPDRGRWLLPGAARLRMGASQDRRHRHPRGRGDAPAAGLPAPPAAFRGAGDPLPHPRTPGPSAGPASPSGRGSSPTATRSRS